MNNNYYYNILKDAEKHAGTKAVIDCNYILRGMGYEPINLYMLSENDSVIVKAKKYLSIFLRFFQKANTRIVIQHPIGINRVYMKVLKLAKRIRHLEYIFLVHDLISLRRAAIDTNVEIDDMMLEIADFIVSHNDKMTDYLVKRKFPKERIVNIEVFDYLGNVTEKAPRFCPVLNIAGNLDVEKCKYLLELNSIDNGTQFNLYGINFDNEVLNSSAIHYCGAFAPEEVPNQLKEGFGLVWDGTSISALEGSAGEYVKYNNPHKLSLYLVSGLPVVISEDAAEADYVKANNVGIVVKKIEDFKQRYDKMTQEEYKAMVECVKECSKKINRGYYLERAMKEIKEKQL